MCPRFRAKDGLRPLTLLRFLAALLLWPGLLLAAHPFLCTDSFGGKVAAVTADGTIEWEYACPHPQDCWVLPNGNTIFCNYLGHGHIGEQPYFFEITRDKQVVWQFADHAHFKTINQIQLLAVPGDVTKGEILR